MQFAHIELREGTPYATLFDDVYFSRHDGLNESRYVYLQQNDLPARLPQAAGEFFTIGEAGFGTGLNFLTAWQAWRDTRPPTAAPGRLHFVSTEQFPVHPQQLPLLLTAFRDPLPVSAELLAVYQQLTPGWNRFSFRDAELTLYIGDAATGLQDYEASVDAWFLDGFSPAKSPEFWRPELYHAMARLSHSGTTLASFTATGGVRQGLTAAGFKVARCPGFGRKWHMIRGRFAGLMGPRPFARHDFWWPRPAPMTPGPDQSIAIIGAGLAAAELAPRLHARGFPVTLIAPSTAGEAASGNAQGALYAKPGLEADPATSFYAQALSYRLRHWQTHTDHWPGAQTGLLQLLPPARWQRLANTLAQEQCSHPFAQLMAAVSAERASELAGVTLSQPGLWFARSGWLSPRDYCQQRLQGLPQLYSTADQLTFDGETDTWQVTDGQGQPHRFAAVIIAAGHHSARWPQSAWLPIKPVRGQVSAVTVAGAPRVVICGEQYVTPANARGEWSFGASFDVKADHEAVTEADQAQNREGLAGLSPDLAAAVAEAASTERAGVRATTPDYLPLVGPLLSDNLRQRDPRRCFQPWTNLYQPGLYVLTGLGSKGLTSAPVLAEYLTCQLTGEPLPFGPSTERRVHAGRRWLKDAFKGERPL